MQNLNHLSSLLKQTFSSSILSEINSSTSKISRLIENLPSEEDFFQSAVNLIYIQSFYNLTEKEMAKVSIDSYISIYSVICILLHISGKYHSQSHSRSPFEMARHHVPGWSFKSTGKVKIRSLDKNNVLILFSYSNLE